MKKVALVAVMMLSLVATAAWAAGPMKIGVVLPFSGPVGSDGQRTFNGVELAVKEINAAGGIDFNGKKTPIEIVREDSTCNPRMSVAAVEKLMTRDKVSVVIGDFCSTSTLADAEVAKRNKVPQITPISIAPPHHPAEEPLDLPQLRQLQHDGPRLCQDRHQLAEDQALGLPGAQR